MTVPREEYTRKRDFTKTREPAGAKATKPRKRPRWLVAAGHYPRGNRSIAPDEAGSPFAGTIDSFRLGHVQGDDVRRDDRGGRAVNEMKVARGLGWFSIGLGAAEMVAG